MSRKALIQLMLVAITFYLFTMFWHWQFVAVFLGSLLFHEYGHVWAMKRYGMNVKGVYVIPFMGAAAVSAGRMPHRLAEVVIAIMGPVWGLVLAIATYGAYLATGYPLLLGIVWPMAMLNLFNLLPFNPLDGGRVAKSLAYHVSPRTGVGFLMLGIAATVILGLYLPIPIIITAFIAFFGFVEMRSDMAELRKAPIREIIVGWTASFLGMDGRGTETLLAELDRRYGACERREDELRFADDYEQGVVLAVAAHEARDSRNAAGHAAFEHGMMVHEAFAYSDSVAGSRFGRFLSHQPMPELTRRQFYGSGLAYVAVIAAFIFLMGAAAGNGAAMEALASFIRGK